MSTKLLLVEDDLDLGELTKMSLQLRGYDVALARTTAEAVAALDRARPDVVVLDYFLQGALTGLDVLRALKENAAMNGVVVVFMSGLLDKEVQEELFRHGAAALLTKPLQLDALSALLDTIAQENAAANLETP
jgi:DNA-binding response OmpR family regulator